MCGSHPLNACTAVLSPVSQPGCIQQCIPVAIPGTEQRCMRSLDGSRTYRIFIAKPFGEQPPAGYLFFCLKSKNKKYGTPKMARMIPAGTSDGWNSSFPAKSAHNTRNIPINPLNSNEWRCRTYFSNKKRLFIRLFFSSSKRGRENDMAQEKLQQSVNAAECIPVAIPGTEQRPLFCPRYRNRDAFSSIDRLLKFFLSHIILPSPL